MSLDVNKIIMESIQEVIEEEGTLDTAKKVVKDTVSGEVGGKLYDKLHPENTTVQDAVTKISKKLKDVKAELTDTKNMTAGEHLSIAASKIKDAIGENLTDVKGKITSAGKKVLDATGENLTDVKGKITSVGRKVLDQIKDHPKIAAATAAALAAGVGALALRRRLKNTKK